MNFWVCPSCGKKVSDKIKACPHCKVLRQIETTNPPEITVNHYKAVIIALALIIVSGAAYLVVSGNKDQVNSTSNNTDQGAKDAQPKLKMIKQKDMPAAAIDAFKAFKKMQARTQVGISHKDYSEALAEVRLALNMYMESSASKDLPELTLIFKKAYQGYDFAKDIWKEKFSGNGVDKFTPKEQFDYVFTVFPSALKEVKDGGIISKDVYPGKDYIYIEAAIPFLFSAANEQIQLASRLIER